MMAASSTTNLTAGSAIALSISSRMRLSMYGCTKCSSRLRSTGLGKTIRPNFLRSTFPSVVRTPRSPQMSTTRARMSGCSRASCPSGSPATILPPCRTSAWATVLLPAPMPPTRPRTGLRWALVMTSTSGRTLEQNYPCLRPGRTVVRGSEDGAGREGCGSPHPRKRRTGGSSCSLHLLHLQPVLPRRHLHFQRHIQFHRPAHLFAHQLGHRRHLLRRGLEHQLVVYAQEHLRLALFGLEAPV